MLNLKDKEYLSFSLTCDQADVSNSNSTVNSCLLQLCACLEGFSKEREAKMEREIDKGQKHTGGKSVDKEVCTVRME